MYMNLSNQCSLLKREIFDACSHDHNEALYLRFHLIPNIFSSRSPAVYDDVGNSASRATYDHKRKASQEVLVASQSQRCISIDETDLMRLKTPEAIVDISCLVTRDYIIT